MARWKRLLLFSDCSRQELDRSLCVDREEDPPTRADQALLAEAITRALQEMIPKDREVLILRYGLKDAHCHSIDEVARTLRYSRHYARAIECAALRRLGFVLRRQRAPGTRDDID